MAQSLFGKGIGADRTHNGIIQGGNKSLLCFRSDIGIPGYTGFIPSSVCLPPPHKGSTKHTGRIPDEGAADQLAVSSLGDPRTIYRSTARQYPASTYETSRRKDGGYWIVNGNREDRGENEPSIQPHTIYRKSFFVDKGEEGREGEEERVLREWPQPKAEEEVSGRQWQSEAMYQSTYKGMVISKPKVGGAAAAGKFERRVKSAPNEVTRPLEENICKRQSVQAPGGIYEGHYSQDSMTTMYGSTFGKLGRNPLEDSSRLQRDTPMNPGTRELNLGTSKGGKQLAGYSGHVPANSPLPETYTVPRRNEKDDMLLHSLGQYGRGHLPQYQGFKPQVSTNVHDWQGPPKSTTQGEINNVVMNAISKPGASSCRGNIDQQYQRVNPGIMRFFANGSSPSCSDNGKALAQRYFHLLRPKEGLPRISYPSQTTVSGYRFKD